MNGFGPSLFTRFGLQHTRLDDLGQPPRPVTAGSDHIMKLYVLIIAILTTILSGCEQPPTGDVTTTDKSANVLHLSDSIYVLLRGTLQKSYKKPNNSGFLNVHEFVYSGVDKVAENDVYAVLKANGYKRKIIVNDANQFKVQYYKRSVPVIGAAFTTRSQENGYQTLASIYWQEK